MPRPAIVWPLLALLIAFAPNAHATSFTFTPFDPPGGPFFTIIPFGINDADRISGVFTDVGLNDHGFFRDPGGAFTSFDHPDTDFTKVFAVRGTEGLGINNAGQIVGDFTKNNIAHGFLRDPGGTFTTIDVPGHTHTAISGINDAGVMVGVYDDTSAVSAFHGFVRDAGGIFTLFDFPGATTTSADAINNASQIVGVYNTMGGTNPFHAFRRDPNGTFTSLDVAGASETVAAGINDAGDIVGDFTDASGNTHGFLRGADGTFFPFDVPGATFTAAIEINNAGQITGQFCDSPDSCHGFLAIPVPEPAPLALVTVGVAVLIPLVRWRAGTRREGACGRTRL